MELRSNFEAGTSRWATRRAQRRALGLSDEDMAKPKIAVVNSPSDLAICYSHLDEIARKAKEAIRAAGWIGFKVRTTAPSDFIHSAGSRGGYILASRDLIVNDIAAGVEGAARRQAVPDLLRQDRARTADGGGQAEHPHDRGRLRVPALRHFPGRTLRHRGRVPRRGACGPGAARDSTI